MRGYRVGLPYIHDAGFSGFSQQAAPGLLRLLKQNGVGSGLVTDLGCGSGRWARELSRAGYGVVGVDQSVAFIRLAREIAPRASFGVASLFEARLPACDAVTSIGECVNYRFDVQTGKPSLARLFARVYRALRPGGIFIFDAAGPARVPENGPRKLWVEGGDWAILVETDGDRRRGVLTRQITAFGRLGTLYRRSEETHCLKLYRPAEVVKTLRRTGFDVERLNGYGRLRFPPGISGFLARKD